MKENKAIQRIFILGDEWLFYKIYCGVKTADTLLVETIRPIANHLIINKIIDKWFFIRYADPKIHIRIRFHLLKQDDLIEIINMLSTSLKSFFHQNLIWKIQTDTYQREIERYGENTIEITENLFYYDSLMIINSLGLFKGDQGETKRWLFGVRAIDAFFDDFNFNTEQKKDLAKFFSENYNIEFNMNKDAKANLGRKYRKERQLINEVLDRSKEQNSTMLLLFNLLKEKTKAIKPFVDEIIMMNNNDKLQVSLNSLIGSYIHMFCNRLFRSKQKLHELVLYTFLQKYYESEIAKNKKIM